MLTMKTSLQMATEVDFFDAASWQSLTVDSITARGERGLGEFEPVMLETLIPTKTRSTETVIVIV